MLSQGKIFFLLALFRSRIRDAFRIFTNLKNKPISTFKNVAGRAVVLLALERGLTWPELRLRW